MVCGDLPYDCPVRNRVSGERVGGDAGSRLWRAPVGLDSLGHCLSRPPDYNRVSRLLGSHRSADMDLVAPPVLVEAIKSV